MGIERLSNEEHGPDPPIKVSTEAGSMPSRPPRLRRIAKTFASLGLCLIVLFTLFERAFLPPHGPRSFTRHRPIPSADLSSSLSDIPSNATSPGSNYLLSSLAGLGLQWPNTVHPCGHIAVPALVEIGTPLYHARTDAGDVPSPEWLAFDPEMSFAIMVGRGSPNGT